jgi:hypothetical protein
MHMAEHDPDLFVQREAVKALGALQDLRSDSLLSTISGSTNRFLAIDAKRSLRRIHGRGSNNDE